MANLSPTFFFILLSLSLSLPSIAQSPPPLTAPPPPSTQIPASPPPSPAFLPPPASTQIPASPPPPSPAFPPPPASPPPPSPAFPPPPAKTPIPESPAPLPEALPEFSAPPPAQQLRNIIDALIGAGDFTGWVAILQLANPLLLPMSTTFFIPQDGKGSLINNPTPTMNPLLFPYHIVPQRLSFSDLLLFKPYTRIPTLLPNKSILITNTSPSNFTINNVPITHPNLYNTDSISVHGISSLLDYSVFGESFPPPPPTTETSNPGNQVSNEGILAPPPEGILTPIGDPSDAACSCTEAPIVFLIFCGVLAFKMQKIPFVR